MSSDQQLRDQRLGKETITDIRIWKADVASSMSYVFYEVATSAGRIGVGESVANLESVAIANALFDQLVRGHRVDEIAHIATKLGNVVGALPTFAGGLALSALDQCLTDLRGQALGLPIYELLGGRRRNEIPLYANINRGTFSDRSPENFANTAARARAAGFGGVKIAPFDNVRPSAPAEAAEVQDGLDRIAAVREAIGDDVRLFVDCHGRLGIDTCYSILPRLEELRLAWLEEPFISNVAMQAVDPGSTAPAEVLPAQPVSAFQGLVRRTALPLAGAEHEFGLRAFADVLESGVLSYVMVDVKYCGGVGVARAVADLVASYGAKLAPHNPNGPIASLHSMHICLAAPEFEILEFQWGEVPDRATVVDPEEPFVEGALIPNDRPGLGFTIDHGALKEVATAVTQLAN